MTIKRDKPMVLIPIDENESMKETIELLLGNPNLPRKLREERKKIEKGEYITFESLKKKYKIK